MDFDDFLKQIEEEFKIDISKEIITYITYVFTLCLASQMNKKNRDIIYKACKKELECSGIESEIINKQLEDYEKSCIALSKLLKENNEN